MFSARNFIGAWIAAAFVVTACSGPMPVATASPHAAGEQGKVTKVTDGDTIHVSLAGRDVDVRIIGVDTPETKKPRTPVQCWGDE